LRLAPLKLREGESHYVHRSVFHGNLNYQNVAPFYTQFLIPTPVS